MLSIKELFKIGHGPSSSHTIGPMRGCEFVLNKYKDIEKWNKVVVTLYGSFALTGKGHLTDIAIKEVFKDYPTEIINQVELPEGYNHPNTMRISLYNENVEVVRKYVVSIGGGTIVVSNEPPAKEVYPFANFNEIKEYINENKLTPYEFLCKFEGKKEIDELFDKMFLYFEKTIKDGLAATKPISMNGAYFDRRAKIIFDNVSKNEDEYQKRVRLVSAYAYATMEQSDSYGFVVTAPTCGSCGVLPAIMKYMNDEYKLSKQQIHDAIAAAGIVGITVKHNGAVAGATGGCQAEVGVATAMGAAMVASILYGPNADYAEKAAIAALKNVIGLTCDPVKGFVFVPCIQRNAIYALNAIAAATNIGPFKDLDNAQTLSLDDYISISFQNGNCIKDIYRETSLGGLAKHAKYTVITDEDLKQKKLNN